MRKFILYSLILCLLFIQIVEAKWWIFGVSEDEITIKYLYLNNTSYDELGQKVTVYKETLEDGNIVIKGKATVKTGKIANVRISINNKESWEKAKLSREGDFEFRFRPELNKTYIVYIEIMDTRGKTNDIESTRKEITVSERNITAMVKETLEAMAEAYRREDAGRFMSYVADDFAGDAVNLDRAIRKDFSLFDNIDLRFTINNVASGSKGIVVSINFSRSLVSSRTGKLLSDRGITEFVFKHGEGGLKVYSMKFPLIFGLSDASNVATGVIQNPNPNEPTIVVDDKGNVVKEPFDQAVKTVMEGTALETGTFTLNFKVITGGILAQGFNFKDGEVIDFSSWPPPTEVDMCISLAEIEFNSGTKAKNLGKIGINNVREVPESGYEITYINSNNNPPPTVIGNVYALKLRDGKYALLEIIDWTVDHIAHSSRASFKYKYQPDGSRRF